MIIFYEKKILATKRTKKLYGHFHDPHALFCCANLKKKFRFMYNEFLTVLLGSLTQKNMDEIAATISSSHLLQLISVTQIISGGVSIVKMLNT